MDTTRHADRTELFNKVPAITIAFWIIKVLATTVGETAADVLSTTLNLGLTITSYVMAALLIIALVVQVRSRKYVPTIYWIAVVLISVVGTLISDNLVDNLGVSLTTTSTIFAVALVVVFAVWYVSEKTLSVHTIYTVRRELFYWAAILFTFSLGTSAGDLLSESLGVGYAIAALIFAAGIAVVFIAYKFGMNAILAFWIAYILTRPLGASMGDLLTQPKTDGGFGLGTISTSLIFLAVIVILVVHLTRELKRHPLQPVNETRGSERPAVAQPAPSAG